MYVYTIYMVYEITEQIILTKFFNLNVHHNLENRIKSIYIIYMTEGIREGKLRIFKIFM